MSVCYVCLLPERRAKRRAKAAKRRPKNVRCRYCGQWVHGAGRNGIRVCPQCRVAEIRLQNRRKDLADHPRGFSFDADELYQTTSLVRTMFDSFRERGMLASVEQDNDRDRAWEGSIALGPGKRWMRPLHVSERSGRAQSLRAFRTR